MNFEVLLCPEAASGLLLIRFGPLPVLSLSLPVLLRPAPKAGLNFFWRQTGRFFPGRTPAGDS